MAKPVNAIKGFIEVTIQGDSIPMLIPLHNIAGVTQRNSITKITVIKYFAGVDVNSHTVLVAQSYEEVLRRIKESAQ
ncbi:hypothetical protein [uncultured Hymenobacter sp.]|uniref:hypothetical protein n=1 Tax=uncultured Hymenobacter sp. TaxID=170016 RepID=UPI0035CB34D0